MLVCKLNLDNTGATVSWLCVVHCVAMPLVVSLLPLVGLSFLADERLEWLFLSTSLLIAMLSLLPAYFRRHNKIRTLVFFALGMTLVVLARELFEDSGRYQIPLLIFGMGMNYDGEVGKSPFVPRVFWQTKHALRITFPPLLAVTNSKDLYYCKGR